MKMRRSRQRKKIIGSRQIGIWSPGTSSGPSYEAFTIPTPRGYPLVEAPGNNVDTSLTGRKRPASDAEHVQDSAPCGSPRQNVVVERSESNDASTCQHLLDGGVGSARPVQQAPSTGVKQIVLRLSGLRQSSATFEEPPSVKYDEPAKDVGTEADSQDETHRAAWSTVTDCTENRQNGHVINCSHPDLQSSSQNTNIIPTVRILHQPFQISSERGSKEELPEAQKEGKPGSAVSGDDSGGCIGNLPPIDESRCVLDSSNGQARCGGFGHELPVHNNTGSFPHPANPSWIMNANVCRSCPVTYSRSNPSMSGCNACAATRFATPCSFQRGVPRAVRYYVEPTPQNQMKHYPNRIEPPACCQRMDFQGAKQPAMYAKSSEQDVDDPQIGRGRNLDLPSGTAVEGHTCGSHYISGNDVLVCPAPWVHEGRIFPGTPAMGVNWVPEGLSDSQQRQNAKLEESHRCEMPDPVYPPAHCSNCNFSADMDMDTQHHLEEQIAHEILLLSQKLANLQARYGARRPVHNNTKPAVLSCPQTPLLLDNTIGSQKDVKSNPRAPSISQSMKSDDSIQRRPATASSSRFINRQSDPRLEEKKLGVRNIGTNKGTPSTSAPSSNRGSDSGTTAAFNSSKNHSHSRTGSRGSGAVHNGCQHGANEVAPIQGDEKVFRETVETGKASRNSRIFASPYKRRRERRTEEHVDDQCSYSDDMKDRLRTGGANAQGYPNGNKRFDWVKTLRFGGAGVRDNQGCADLNSQMQIKDSSSPQKEFEEVDPETWLRDSGDHEIFPRDTKTSMSVSKSVQAGGASPDCIESSTWAPTDSDDRRDSESRPKIRPDRSIENRSGKCGMRTSSPEDMGGLDSRITHHLLKAGLRRAPSLWKLTPGYSRQVSSNALRLKKKAFGSRSPRRDGGRRLRRRTLSDLNMMAYPVKALHEEKFFDKKESESQAWQLKEKELRKCEDAIDAQWQREVADYEAEYETFVENTEDSGIHDNLDTEEYTSTVNREVPTSGSHSEEDAQKRSPSSVSTQEKARLSEAPVLSLAKTPPATKKTFIRCIELVVATKKKIQLSKINGRKANPGGPYAYRRVDCSERPSTDGYGSLDKDCYVKTHANGGKHATSKTNGYS
ncbi:hypothetical protein M758_3G225300 [Ceratodon purpureus]|nr:hypothetical protein M758_3G225300 [Ceratodon purpureus]